MNEKTKNLQNLLKLVKELSSRDDLLWFKKELVSFLTEDINAHSNQINIESEKNNIIGDVKKIEEYLSIKGVEVIDYSKIKNEKVKNQLYRDSLEMSKYRLGKHDNKINFDEFCRYAFLQCEELINYFYFVYFDGDITKANNFIKKHWDTYKPPSSKKISDITMGAKLTGFFKEYGFKNTNLDRKITFLKNLRNELSHRNSYKIDQEDSILSSLALKKIDVSNNYIDFKKTSEHDLKLYKKGRFIFLKREQDYKKVIDSIVTLKETIVYLLNK